MQTHHVCAEVWCNLHILFASGYCFILYTCHVNESSTYATAYLPHWKAPSSVALSLWLNLVMSERIRRIKWKEVAPTQRINDLRRPHPELSGVDWRFQFMEKKIPGEVLQLNTSLIRSFSWVRHWSDDFLIKTRKHPGLNNFINLNQMWTKI